MAKEERFHYGGQAVLEGVMIRGRTHVVTAIRKPDKTIHIDKNPLPSLYTGRLRKAPLFRGIIVLIESLVLGIQTLMTSANVALESDEQTKDAAGGWVWVMLVFSLVVTVALFFLAPLFLTRLLHIGGSLAFNLVEGLIRLGMFVGYISLVSLMPDIKRVFAYHGAEHKTVNGFEHDAALEPAALRKFSKAHVRCGGSFLFVVLIIAIIVFTIVGKPDLWLMILSRVVLVPVIAALGYEVIYFGARHTDNFLVKVVLAPGLWIQSITTREPDDAQLEVAIAAMKTAVDTDNPPPPVTEAPAPPPAPQTTTI